MRAREVAESVKQMSCKWEGPCPKARCDEKQSYTASLESQPRLLPISERPRLKNKMAGEEQQRTLCLH